MTTDQSSSALSLQPGLWGPCPLDRHSLLPELPLFFVFLGPHLQPMEVPRLGVESELQLPACTTATATPDPSHICDLLHSSWQRRILNPLSEARDQTYILSGLYPLPAFTLAAPWGRCWGNLPRDTSEDGRAGIRT